MRSRLDEQLYLLNKKMIELSAKCETMIANASRALLDGNPVLAQQVVEDGSGID